MANVFVNEDSLSDIADAIRSKLNVQTTYKPGEMAAAIESISGGGITPTGTKSITENGTYDVTSFASAEVNVPTGSTPVINSLSVTENGTYTAPSGVDGYSPITVNVPQGSTPTGTKQISIAENGTTIEDVSAYANAEISVNVPSTPTYENITAKFKNGRASGTASIYAVQYNSTLGMIGASNQSGVTVGNTSGSINCLLQNGYIYIHAAWGVTSVTYNDEAVAFSKNTVSSQTNLKIPIPDNYDNTIPFVLA